MTPALAELREVADVSLGITLRGADASRHDPDGTHQLIRISDLDDDGVLSIGEPNLIHLDDKSARRNTLRAGDVLLAARGIRMTAAVFDQPIDAVAGGQFLVIRPQTDTLLAPYLRWFLNLPQTQEQLLAAARGSYVRSLPAKSLAQFQIPIPPIPQQRAIAELHQLRLHEKQLMEQLAERRAILLDHSILKSLDLPASR